MAGLNNNWHIHNSKMRQMFVDGDAAVITQPYIEVNVKRGYQWYFVEEFSLPTSGVETLGFETADTPIIIKYIKINAEGGLRYFNFEDSDYTGGVSVNALNFNRNSGASSSVTLVTNPTVNSQGTQIDVQRSYSATGNGVPNGLLENDGVEKILKPNTKYLFEFDSEDGSTKSCTFGITWYEGNPDFSLENT